MAEEFPFQYVPPVDLNLGRRVDQYFILRTLLGRGGMGAAYLAEHEALAHIKCVIKLVLAELARQPMAINRYKTETEAVSRLKHDNIVKLQNFGVLEDGQLFMRFEYIEGKSLGRYVSDRGGRLSLREAAYFIFQLCDALQYAHDVGVIHRDLKPDNLMVETNPPGSHLTERVKILDFGIAKVMSSTAERTAAGVSMGTPRFMAPEQVTNAAAATGRADVFSVAVIFYQLVTGTLPWGTPESDIAIYHKQRTETPVRPAADLMRPEVTDVVVGALSLVPEERPTMREFAIDLACAIQAENDAPSGTEILMAVKRSWVTASLPHTQTLPRPAAEPSGTAMRALLAGSGPETAGGVAAHLREVPRATRVDPTPAHSRSSSVRGVTANERPSAIAASAAHAGSGTVGVHLATPVLAALPTGLVSQRFAAQQTPVEARALPIAVASEIDMATGTPGPQPYAHAELPAIVVSTTQLSPLQSPSSEPRARVEPATIRLPRGARPSRRARSLLVAGALLAFCVAGIVAWSSGRPPEKPDTGENMSSGTPPAAGPAHHADVPRAPAPPAIQHSSVSTASPASAVTTAAAGASPPADAPASRPSSEAAGVEPPDRKEEANLARSPDATTAARPASRHGEDRTGAPLPEPASSPRSTATAASATKESGELAILVRPWAAIWLNGKAVPDGTPYRAQVPTGRYHIRIANDDLAKTETLTVTVTARKTTIVERKW